MKKRNGKNRKFSSRESSARQLLRAQIPRESSFISVENQAIISKELNFSSPRKAEEDYQSKKLSEVLHLTQRTTSDKHSEKPRTNTVNNLGQTLLYRRFTNPVIRHPVSQKLHQFRTTTSWTFIINISPMHKLQRARPFQETDLTRETRNEKFRAAILLPKTISARQ